MNPNTFNVSATLNVFRLLARPNLCLPHATIPTFNDLPIPLNKAFGKYKNVDIKAVVLDKDNCFAYPKSNDIHKPYDVGFLVLLFITNGYLDCGTASFTCLVTITQEDSLQQIRKHLPNFSKDRFGRLKEAYPGRRLLIVSNTAGAHSIDPRNHLATAVEKSTGIHVLPHADKKPGCGLEIMEYFRKHPETGVTRPDQIAIVGDRLTTDVLMANLMGSYAIWVQDGVMGLEKAGFVSDSYFLSFGF